MSSRNSADVATQDDVERAVLLFGREMYGLALAIASNVQDAEDAYQAAWVDAIRHWDQLRDASKRRQWLAAIVARSARRSKGFHVLWLRRHTYLGEASQLSTAMDGDPAVAIAVSRLSDRQRAVIALHYGQGYSLDEIAVILKCRNGTVRSHLSRALANLRGSLRDDKA